MASNGVFRNPDESEAGGTGPPPQDRVAIARAHSSAIVGSAATAAHCSCHRSNSRRISASAASGSGSAGAASAGSALMAPTLDQPAFRWNHRNADKLIYFKDLEHPGSVRTQDAPARRADLHGSLPACPGRPAAGHPVRDRERPLGEAGFSLRRNPAKMRCNGREAPRRPITTARDIAAAEPDPPRQPAIMPTPGPAPRRSMRNATS